MPIVEVIGMVKDGFQFLNGIMTDLQIGNLMRLATAVIISGKFNLSGACRVWLKKRTVNALSHCLMKSKFSLNDAMKSFHKMMIESSKLQGGRFIIDDTLEHHSRLCKFIHGVFKHYDHVFHKTMPGKCLVFLYYCEGNWIKFPIGWKIYYENGEKTKNDLALELIKEALANGFVCSEVLADSWYCVNPFVSGLQKLGLIYILDCKTNATIRVKIKIKNTPGRRGRKRTKWYRTENIIDYMNKHGVERTIGFTGDIQTAKTEKVLYQIKETICQINALDGMHKIVRSYDPKKNTTKFLITNELTWEGLKVVKEYFKRWIIEEFFRNIKQQLDMEGACVRSEQGVTITLLLLTCIDALIHRKIAELASLNPQSGAITFQSVIRLAFLENAENFVEKIRSEEGNIFLNKWLSLLRKDSIINRIKKSEVVYLGLGSKPGGAENAA